MLFGFAPGIGAADVSPGDAAPAFVLHDQDGKEISSEQYKDKVLVLEWTNPECPFVKRHYREGTMKKLEAQYQMQGVAWLAINSSKHMGSEQNKAFLQSYGIPYPVLDDHPGTVGKQYGAKTTPHMFVIDRSGKLAYQGAIDDDSSGDGQQRTNYVAAALDAVIAGKPVAVSETKPYGCSVKYLN